MYFQYNSWYKKFKTPFGAIKSQTRVTFNVKSDANIVYLHGFGNKLIMKKQEEYFSISIIPELEYGLSFYSFEAIYNNKSYFYGRSNETGETLQNGEPYQLTIHKNSDNPDWFLGKIMYQIYVDRFYKGINNETNMKNNILIHSSWDEPPVYIKDTKGEVVLWDFFGGNLDGVIQKLNYIKSLGVDIIYLNPIFESPSNHKYDTSDYNKVDSMYGTDNTLKKLVKEAQKLEIKIMLDGVFSHTADDSIFFNKYKNYGNGGAYNDKNSPYFPWYSFSEYPNKYDCWWGVTSLPSVNELSPSYLDYLLNDKDGAVIKWMKLGIAGWRLDVADELPDEFIRKLKKAILKINQEAVLLGEVWEDASNKISYEKNRNYILENSLDSVSNYPLRDNLISLLIREISPKTFGNNIMTLQENYPNNIFLSLMNMTGTHDSSRLFTLLGNAPLQKNFDRWEQRKYSLPENNQELAKQRLFAFYTILFTLPGNPCIYYGDEICLEGYKDPYNRGTYNWNTVNTEIISHIKTLSLLRKNLHTKKGFIRFIENDNLLIYKIKSDDYTYTTYINVSDTEKEIAFDNNKTLLFSYFSKVNDNNIVIGKFGTVIIS